MKTDETVTPAPTVSDPRERGVTPRVIVLCLTLAFGFGYIIPIIDVRLQNTFLGATQLPVGGVEYS